MSRQIGALFLIGCVGLSLSAFAATRDDLQKVESRLDQQKQQAAALAEAARQTSDSLQELRQKLITATAQLQAKEEEQDALEDKLDDLTQDVADKTRILKEDKRRLSLMTGALIELSRQPPVTEWLQTGLTVDHIHRVILLRSAVPRMEEQADIVNHDLDVLNDLHVKLAEQKHFAIAAQENLQGQQRELDQLIKARQGLLQRTEAQKQDIERQLVSLSSEAKDLRQLLDKVAPKNAKPGPLGLVASLKPPVIGNLIRRFGDKDSDGIVSEGLTYAALPGSPVVAPKEGRVVFAGPFRGYGQILILQHPGGYHSFLAGFGRIDADMGQEVAAGEPLGVLPVKNKKPELYFEWRYNKEAIDPARLYK